MWRGLAARTDYSVLVEEDEWLVVGKPAPLIVHPSSDRPEVTLLGELQMRWPEQEFYFVNRLDRETSGCVLIAKTKRAAGVFGKQMVERSIKKQYLAIVHGWPDWEQLKVEEPILRKGEVEESRVWVRQAVHPDGKESTTAFRCLERFERKEERFAIVECSPKTGRTHQIRVHLEHAGFPIVGDKIYGGTEDCYLDFLKCGWSADLEGRLLLNRQALHGSSISIEWKGAEIEVSCPWPEELRQFHLGETLSPVLDASHVDVE